MKVQNSMWLFPSFIPVEMPVGLMHLESDICWCDPLLDVDDDGRQIVVHREVTWN